jgi:gas vesicle protein
MKNDKGKNMRLEEIQSTSGAEQRVKRMKASAKAAKDRARQLKAQADASADRLDLQKARQKLVQQQRSAVTTTIKPYH